MRIFICLLIGIITITMPSNVSGKILASKTGAEKVHLFINPIVNSEEATIEIFLKNDTEKTLEFEFMSSQFYEITISNEQQKTVYQFSDGKVFLQAIQQLIVKPGQTKSWVEKLEFQNNKSLEPGKYIVKVQLTHSSVNGSKEKGIPVLSDEVEMIVPGENPIVKNVKIDEKDLGFIVSGKARPTSGKLFYLVEDGHHEWIKETGFEMKKKYPTWQEFSFLITLPQNKFPGNLPLVLYLYEKDGKGNMIHSYTKHLKKN